jgi:hypothetical protein
MPIASLSGSPGHGQIEWSASPPWPGFQVFDSRSFISGSLTDHVSPSSRDSNNDAGSTPAQSCPGASPGLTIQVRSMELSLPSGKPGPAACCHSVAITSSVQ